jgi:hypothetical protein
VQEGACEFTAFGALAGAVLENILVIIETEWRTYCTTYTCGGPFNVWGNVDGIPNCSTKATTSQLLWAI